MNSIALLERLHGVRETGPGRWVARCPAHEDRAPSLSIRELPDGRVLLHDFAGCDTGSVLEAVGLSLSDLFPDARPDYARPSHSRLSAADVLALVAHEITVARVIINQIRRDRQLSESNWRRLDDAARRMDTVLGEAGR